MKKHLAFCFSRPLSRRAGAWMGAAFWRALWAFCGILRPWLAPLSIAVFFLAILLVLGLSLDDSPREALGAFFGYLFDAFETKRSLAFLGRAVCAALMFGAAVFAISLSAGLFLKKAAPAVSSLQARSLAKAQTSLAQARAFAEAREIERDCAVGAKNTRSKRL